MKNFLIGQLVFVTFFCSAVEYNLWNQYVRNQYGNDQRAMIEIKKIGERAEHNYSAQRQLFYILFDPSFSLIPIEVKNRAKSYLIKVESPNPEVVEWLFDIVSSPKTKEAQILGVEILGGMALRISSISWHLLKLLPSFYPEVESIAIHVLANHVRQDNVLRQRVLDILKAETPLEFYHDYIKVMQIGSPLFSLEPAKVTLFFRQQRFAVMVLKNSGLSDIQTQQGLLKVFLSRHAPIEHRLNSLWALDKMHSLNLETVEKVVSSFEEHDTRIQYEIIRFLDNRSDVPILNTVDMKNNLNIMKNLIDGVVVMESLQENIEEDNPPKKTNKSDNDNPSSCSKIFRKF